MPFDGRITCERLNEKKQAANGICDSAGDCESKVCPYKQGLPLASIGKTETIRQNPGILESYWLTHSQGG